VPERKLAKAVISSVAPALARQKLDNVQGRKTRSGPGVRHENNNRCYIKTRPALARQKLDNATERKTRSGPGSGPGRNLMLLKIQS